MDSLGSLLNTPAVRTQLDRVANTTGELLRQLKPAQILQAIVLNRTSANSVQLQIGKQVLSAHAPASLVTGQQLSLRVERGLPDPVLRILQQPVHLDPLQHLQQQALRRQLPPVDLAQQLQALKQLTQQPPANAQARLPLVSQALQLLAPAAPDLARLTPSDLRRALENSGLFMESTLLREGAANTADRKLLLLRLLTQLRPENRAHSAGGNETADKPDARPPSNADQLLNRLARLVEGAITRIQAHQTLALSTSEQTGQTLWQMDMPLLVNNRREHLELRIRREAEDNPDSTSSGATWKVEVDFDFGELGKVMSRIALSHKRVQCGFWSDKASTAARFEQALPRLEKMLHEAGLEVSAVSALQGDAPGATRPSSQLLDERA